MNPRVDFYFAKAKKWQEEFVKLRMILLDPSAGFALSEELKWGVPCYTYQGSNIVLMHGFKDYCALLFFKGALLKDPKGILVQQTKNVQAARQVRFTSVGEIIKLIPVLKAFVREAIKVEKTGLKVPVKRTADFPVPEEFESSLKKNPELRSAFKSLTPGRQRAYLLYFSAARQTKTRVARIEKCIPRIFNGKGLNDL